MAKKTTEKTVLTPQEELQFQNWMRLPGSNANAWNKSLQNYIDKADPGGTVDLDPAEYDYRAAFKDGFEPTVHPYDGAYHWTSKYKSADHPTMWMEDLYQTYGLDPDETGITKDQFEFLKKAYPNEGNAIRKIYGGQ